MKILHLLYESEGDAFGIGGVGVRAYELYRYLRERHDITLLCKKYPGAVDGEKEGLRHIFVGTESRSLTKTLLSYAFHASLFVKRRGGEFDLIVEEFSPAIPTFLHAFTQKPIILQLQGYTGKLYFKKYNAAYALVLRVLEYLRPRFYNNFIFMNEETVGKFLSDGGVSSSRKKRFVAIIPNGVSHELLRISPEEGNYILFIGRIDIYGKGLDILLDAYREFHESFPGIRLVIAGDGRDREAFHAGLSKLPEDVRKNIEMPGWVSGEGKEEVIRKALYVVFPSRHEVQPIAALEAMACEKPVVVSDIPEFRFVTKEGVGMCFEAGNAASLAQSMRDVMRSEERKEMGKRGRDLVRDFTWDKIAKKYERFLDEIVRSERNA